MNRLNPSKLSGRFERSVTRASPVVPRRYTLTFGGRVSYTAQPELDQAPTLVHSNAYRYQGKVQHAHS
jgi:hypothetical protein